MSLFVAFLGASVALMLPAMIGMLPSILWRAHRAQMDRISGGSLALMWTAMFVAACIGTLVFSATSVGIYAVFALVAVIAFLAGQFLPFSLSK